MMTNKWIQAVLFSGIGLGLIIGSFISAISNSPFVVMIIGFLLMTIGLWKSANCRGTDGWGGPFRGPSKGE